jgi:hypothetical protein
MTGPEEDETAVVIVGLDTKLLRPTLGVLERADITGGAETTGLGIPRISGLWATAVDLTLESALFCWG